MQLFETKLTLRSIYYGVNTTVASNSDKDIVRAVYNHIRKVLDIAGTDNKITAIRLIRHLTKCDLLDSKGYSK